MRWALVTAHNPGGLRAGDAQNRRADLALRRVLRRAELNATRAINGADDWREPGWLVVGLDLRAARNLGQRFGQLAVVAGVGARAALVPARPELGRLWRGWAVRA